MSDEGEDTVAVSAVPKRRKPGNSLEDSYKYHDSNEGSDGTDGDESLFTTSADKSDAYVPQLCSHCQYICDNLGKVISREVNHFPHYPDTYALEASVLNGCGLCTQFWNSVCASELEYIRYVMQSENNKVLFVLVMFGGRGPCEIPQDEIISMRMTCLADDHDFDGGTFGYSSARFVVEIVPTKSMCE